MANIIKNIPAMRHDLIEAYLEQSSATVHESMGKRGAMTAAIKPIEDGMKVCGQALTVNMAGGDNLMLIKAISMATKGQVIVLNNGNFTDCGPFGEVLAVECVSKGVAGLVTSGSVRDSREVRKLGFPVFSSGLSIIGTTKAASGTINHPLTCGNVIVNPGDIVLGDADGVVVIPLEEAEDILQQAKARDEKERKIMEQLKTGASLFEIYGYQKTFDELHVTEED